MAFTAEHFDYTHQVWIGADGRYLSCAHPDSMNCKCFGKLHAGELALSATYVCPAETRPHTNCNGSSTCWMHNQGGAQ